MKLIRRANTEQVTPSSRDAIESWLDVLVSMLNLPPSQRTHVRDELEDHIRSRVDDLLITGTPEPEAIRQAVAELGETADLAKTITAANRTTHPLRRYTMHVLITIAAGSLIALGITANNTTITMNALPQAVMTEAQPVSGSHSSDPFNSFTIDVSEATIADLFQRIDWNTDKPLIVHWGLLSEISVKQDTPIEIDAEPITAGLVLTILAERSERNMGDSIAVLEKDDRIEIGTRSQFDRRTREKRIYDLSVFTSGMTEVVSRGSNARVVSPSQAAISNSMNSVVDLLRSHISTDDWTSLGGDLASATVLNATLVITAPERMHREIDALLQELIKQHKAQQNDQRIQSQLTLERISAEYEAAKRTYLAKLQDEVRTTGAPRSADSQSSPDAAR